MVAVLAGKGVNKETGSTPIPGHLVYARGARDRANVEDD
jgi:hypothetical protein